MTQLNQYNLYSMACSCSNVSEPESVQKELIRLDDYDKSLQYLNEHFGIESGTKEIEYSSKNKMIIKILPETIKVCFINPYEDWQLEIDK